MSKKTYKYLRGTGLKIWSALILISLTFSCKDDLKFNPNEESDPDNTPEVTLRFPVYLDGMIGTRATNNFEGDIDNYIRVSTKSKPVSSKEMFQVLFLTEDGDFLFQPMRNAITVEETPDGNGQWYVTINLDSSIQDNENNSVLSLVKAYLEAKPFKIAVLANWNDNGTVKEVDWGWEQSWLNTKATDKKSIHDLHHLEFDKSYQDSNNKKNAYSFIMSADYEMGYNTEWVKYRDIDSKESLDKNTDAWHLKNVSPDNNPKLSSDAYSWIRNNWNPKVDKETMEGNEHGIYRHYSKLWQLWNFGEGVTNEIGEGNSAITYNLLGVREDTYHPFRTLWKERNWTTSGSIINLQSWFTNDNYVIGRNTSNNSYKNVDGLKVITKGSEGTTTESENYVRSFMKTISDKSYNGIVLPQMNSDAIDAKSESGKPAIKTTSEYAWEYISFSVPGTGKLRLLMSSLDGSEAEVVLQRGSTWEANFTAPPVEKNGDIYTKIDVKEVDKDCNLIDINGSNFGYTVKITAECEDLILWCKTGSVVIYAIEYVCDDFLDYTDREGIIPTESNPIPMYGVQQFPQLDAWGSQEVINMNEPLSLIRALAKVELYLPVGDEISHVYLRSMNRKARIEPMDVLSNTGDLWQPHVENNDLTKNCEWFRICNYGYGYKESSFQNWYKWFYGSWESWWNYPGKKNRADGDEDEQGEEGNKEANTNYPHLFNPDVQRSDFCHFIKDPTYEENNYHRYILYVPDKSIADPNTENNLSSTPKVCHIEYRKAGQTDYLDDNNCYRIYFTDYTTNAEIKTILHDQFDNYEKDLDFAGYDNGKVKTTSHPGHLNSLWPIMRNHKYIFYVGQSHTPQEVRVKVLDWNEEEPAHKVEW